MNFFSNLLLKIFFNKFKKFDNSILLQNAFTLIKYKLKDDLRTFFYHAIFHQERMSKMISGFPKVNYYEFGVGEGRSLLYYLSALKLYCKVFNKDFYSFQIFCFDSFEGLPEKKSIKDDHIGWNKGEFSNDLDKIKKKLVKHGIDLKKNNIHFIKGLYENSLTNDLKSKLEEYPPSIINIDVDYYSSTKRVLEWLKSILSSGAILYFDDIWSFNGHPDYGELGAIQEFNKIGDGQLTPFPLCGLSSKVYMFSRKNFEFKENL